MRPPARGRLPSAPCPGPGLDGLRPATGWHHGVMTERYAYLGPEGTFTEAAFRALEAAERAEPLPCATI